MDLGTDRRTLRSWRSTAKQAETVFATCDLMETSESMYRPLSRGHVRRKLARLRRSPLGMVTAAADEDVGR